MAPELTFFDVMRSTLFFVSPVIFVVGVLLLIAEYKYRKLEGVLGKEVWGMKKIMIPKLEATIYTFQESLLKKRVIVGIVCIICSLIFFLAFKGH